ncbi:GFA family protein [Pseudomonas sp. TH32]|uniref:GFA family protein n=1 Tax=Pseudomonas sp. TH32 TaxID=2796397 RepID=UPI0019126FD6|nr:GFA family protein [Pseudomonas sp. TH32]MBK5438150.1 GFA family protein [Pseudomonas sp. TH32]
MEGLHQGSCLCGAVSYRVSTPLKAVTHCHCKKCQKVHGAAFATYASAPKSSVHITSSLQTLKAYESSEGVFREFCSHCGSPLFWSDANGAYPDWISIAIATLDTPFLPGKQKHSCVESKAGWFELENSNG